MKKFIIGFIALITLFFASCGTSTDSNGWYSDFEGAKKIAQSKNKQILLFVNSDADFEGSKKGVQTILSKDFTDAVKKDFVCIHFDFTDLAKVFNVSDSEISDKEQKSIEKRRALLLKQFKVADFYGIQQTPAMNILSKEGYFISSITSEYNSDSAEGFAGLLKVEADEIENFNKKVLATKKGSKEQKIQAIDVLFEETPDIYRLALYDLLKAAVKMDSKNSFGKTGKYLFQIAHTEAYDKILEQDISAALKVYDKYAQNPVIEPENVQALYCVCASLASKLPGAVPEDIIAYLKKADQAYEGENNNDIKKQIEYLESMISASEEASQEQNPEAVSGE